MLGVGIIVFFVGLFVVYVVWLALESAAANKDFAAEFPDDPFSKGMDANWKREGPPPTEQDRSGHIRTRKWALFLDPYMSKTRAQKKAFIEEVDQSAAAVAARARAIALAKREKQRPDPGDAAR